MTRARWPFVLSIAVIGVVLGAGAVLGVSQVNRQTSTDAFCTSCHSMSAMAHDPSYAMSVHQNNPQGVKVRCVDCHLPASNLATETYMHATSGFRDILASWTHDYSNPATWEKRRVELASEVRLDMRRNDSIACRSCHTAASVEPASESGQAAHALMRTGAVTCIDCHFNLVHAPVPPTMSFIRSSGLGGTTK